nr:hypothetical protein [Tanacetum cinerariifolium]
RPRVDPNLLNDFNMATNGNGDDVPPAGGGSYPKIELSPNPQHHRCSTNFAVVHLHYRCTTTLASPPFTFIVIAPPFLSPLTFTIVAPPVLSKFTFIIVGPPPSSSFHHHTVGCGFAVEVIQSIDEVVDR